MSEILRVARLMAWGYGALALIGCANVQVKVECVPQAPTIAAAPGYLNPPMRRCEVKL